MLTVEAPAVLVERRQTPRHPCTEPSGPCATLTGEPDRHVLLHNISTGGVEAIIDREVQPDRLLPIQLFNASLGCSCFNLLRVIYAVPFRDKTWKIGGCF